MNEATIQRIDEVKPVENSDFLDVVKVLGWKVVTKRNEFQVGDLCIFIEIDTLLPERPEFEFMRNKNFRVKTIKLRGQISQGIVFPIGIFDINGSPSVGVDVTEVLGVKHYEKPIPANMGGIAKGNFPSYLHKTDEVRIQSVPGVLEELKGIKVYSSMKCDGTSATYSMFNDVYSVCSRNINFKLDTENNNVYIRMSKKYNIEDKLKGKNICIQGEICGPSIQKNRMNLKDHELFVFNVFDITGHRYYDYNEVLLFCTQNGFKTVPILDVFTFNHTMEQLLQMAKGLYPDTKEFREGIVIRPVMEIESWAIKGRMSFKVLNNDFLLKNGE